MRKKLIVGNWKMNGSLANNERLLRSLLAAHSQLEHDCAVCVPYPYLQQTQELLASSRIKWGAQNVSQFSVGAYTGEVSANMLVEFGCRYVIIGHSERRALLQETNETIAAKMLAALKINLIPILCVGETLTQREAGEARQTVESQLNAVMAVSEVAAFEKCILAYEPIWSIGSGKAAAPEQAQEMHAFIKQWLKNQDAALARSTLILYGGSVKVANASQLLSLPDIDGCLVGGASLDAVEFLGICGWAHGNNRIV